MDSKKMKVKRPKTHPITRAVYISAGVLMGIVLFIFTERMGMNILAMYLIVIGVSLAAILIGTVIHEIGHLIGGLMTGYKFVAFCVKPLSLSRTKEGKLRFGKSVTPGIGGQCVLIPPEPKDGKFPFGLCLAGGFVMNLIFALIFAALAWVVGREPFSLLTSMRYQTLSVGQGMTALILWILAFINLATALNNGIPIKNALLSNDGQNLIDVRRSPEAMRRWRGGMNIAAHLWMEMPVKDMPEEWFYLPTDEELRANEVFVSSAISYFLRLMNLDRVQEAIQLSDRLLADGVQLPGLGRALLRIERACLDMRDDSLSDEERRQRAEAWFDEPTKQVLNILRKDESGIRISYIIALLLDKDEEKAAQLEQKYEKLIEKKPLESEREEGCKFIAEIKKIHERRKAQQ